MAYGDFEDLKATIFSCKFLREKAFNIAKIPKYHWYQKELASMFYKYFFNKKSADIGVNIPLEFNEQLAKELHEPIIRNFK